MRLLALRMKNFRGVKEREVSFAPEGVTVVEGPNESGKSTMLEALDLLLNVKDSSKSKNVYAVVPRGVDEGPWVEVEIQAGPYQFVYTKRWLKKPSTSVHIHRPTREELTGDSAHEQVRAMLEKTVDMDLWRALHMRQQDTTGVAMGECPSLVRALEAAAGPVTLSGDETTVLAAIKTELDRYYTSTGRPTAELKEALEKEKKARKKYTEEREKRDKVEEDIEKYELLAVQLRDCEEERASALHAVQRARSQEEHSRAVEAEWAQVQERRGKAEAQTLSAKKDLASREQLIADHADRESSFKTVLDHTRGRTASIQQEAQKKVLELSEAKEQLMELRRQKLSLREQIEQAAQARKKAQDVVDAAISPLHVQRVQQAAKARDIAQAQVVAVSTAIEMQILTEQNLIIDGETLETHAGEVVRRLAVSPLRITLPEHIEIQISPVAGGEREQNRLHLAQQELDAALHITGFSSLEEVEDALEERVRLVAELDNRTLALTRLQGTHSPSELTEQLEQTTARLERFIDPQVQADQWLSQKTAEIHERESFSRTERDKSELRLSKARDDASDEELKQRVHALENTLRVVQESVHEVQQRRDQLARDGRVQSVQDAEANAQILSHRKDELQNELGQTWGRISVEMQAGHHEEMDAALCEYEDAKDELERVAARARAAQLLSSTVLARRDAAQSRYAAPLEKAINAVGERVFGESFAVQIDSRLQIQSRTLRGMTVDFEALSVGTKEQLGVLMRLACAQLVDASEGSPVIVDDAMGHSDPQRLEKMREIMKSAPGQTIILTCFPGRFHNVGTVVQL